MRNVVRPNHNVVRQALISEIDKAIAEGKHEPLIAKLWGMFPGEPLEELTAFLPDPYAKLAVIRQECGSSGGFEAATAQGWMILGVDSAFAQFLEDAGDIVLALALGIEHPWVEQFRGYKWIKFTGLVPYTNEPRKCIIPMGLGLKPELAMLYSIVTGRFLTPVPASISNAIKPRTQLMDLAAMLDQRNVLLAA
jgi:hypothetical protein